MIEKGFVDKPIDPQLDLKKEIIKMCQQKQAVIMAHYYQRDEIQDIAHYVGDSLALAQHAAKTDAKIIVLCGVHFMGETAKIIAPDRKVLIPDTNAGCSLADSCDPTLFQQFTNQHPQHKVITYVNTSAAVKALTDVVVTSTNARKIVDTFPKDEKIIFGPDKNLGNYINSITGRNMLLWNGACHVHEQFSIEKIIQLKKQHPDALLLAHPECKAPLLALADFIGSTAALLQFSSENPANRFIVATESGILFEMKRKSPQKEFIPAPPNDSTCACNECNYMRLITLEKLYNCLKYEMPEIEIDSDTRQKALIPIQRMLELS